MWSITAELYAGTVGDYFRTGVDCQSICKDWDYVRNDCEDVNAGVVRGAYVRTRIM
jgi:hypothetical protein